MCRSCGTVPLDYVAKRQLRQDLQLGTEADYSIVLTRAEKLHPGIYTFLQGDPRQNVARVQALFETLWGPLRKCAWKHKEVNKIWKLTEKGDVDEDITSCPWLLSCLLNYWFASFTVFNVKYLWKVSPCMFYKRKKNLLNAIEPPLTATSPQFCFVFPADGPYIHAYLNLSTRETSKCVSNHQNNLSTTAR